MRKAALCLCLFTSALLAQTADTAYFRAVMLPGNEVPAVNINARGVADIIAHAVRDSSGQITSGSVQFLLHVNFAAANTAVGLHIHSGGPTVAGPVVIGTNLSAGNSRPLAAGPDIVNLPVQIAGDNATQLTALRGLFTDATQYYVNIHTTDFPGGAIRGQLQPAAGIVLIGAMSQANEVPAITNATATGIATVVAIASLGPNNTLGTGEVYLHSSYTMTDNGTFTGFHIHPGTPGLTGPAVLAATLPAGMPIDSSGSGNLGPYYFEVDLTNVTQFNTFTNLFFNPAGDYINVHTNQHGGGVMRAQLRPTDTMVFPVLMSSANEVAKTSVAATAPALVTLHTIRNEDGTIAAGNVFFDVNFRLPGAATFTGLHIHDAAAGVNGPVTIPMIPNFDSSAPATDTGFGNYFNWTPALGVTSTLNDIVANPENHYVNIHTSADPGGVARAQLASPLTVAGRVNSAIAGNADPAATTVAPGGLITIDGTNLAKVAVDLAGWQGRTIPVKLNGASVTIGGKAAPLTYVSNGRINAQVPVDLPAGTHAVVVDNGNGASNSFNVTVAASAPAIFYSPNPAVVKNSNFSLVSASNPATAGDIIVVYLTGLGQTTPALTSGGVVASDAVARTATVTATIGGKEAQVLYSIASPGYVGLYQVALVVPTGLTGSQPIVITQGSAKSNTVNVAVQ